jgi:hypothetical protein
MTHTSPEILPYEAPDSERFPEFASAPELFELWNFLANPESVSLMIESCTVGKAAIVPLIPVLQSRFAPLFAPYASKSERFPFLCLNYVKRIMEKLGYVHSACMLIPGGTFVTSAAIFALPQDDEIR